MQSEVETKSDSEDEEIMCLEPSLKKIQKLNISQTSVHGTSEINKFSDVPQTEVINLDDYSGSNACLNSRINETDRAQALGKTLINRRFVVLLTFGYFNRLTFFLSEVLKAF